MRVSAAPPRALLLRSHDANVSVLDSATENKLPESTIKNLRDHGVRVISGSDAETNRDSYDLVVLSPGIDPESPLAQNFSSRNVEVIGELELGWQFCELPVIAITGTNGKTTTTELVAQMLNACGQRTIACGNIGKPLSAVVRDQSKFDVLDGRSELVSARNDQKFSPADCGLVEFRSRSSRSLRLGRGISHGQAASFLIIKPKRSSQS